MALATRIMPLVSTALAVLALWSARDASAQTPEHTSRVVRERLTIDDAAPSPAIVRVSLEGPATPSPIHYSPRIFRSSLDASTPAPAAMRLVRVDLDRGTVIELPPVRDGKTKAPGRAIRTEL